MTTRGHSTIAYYECKFSCGIYKLAVPNYNVTMLLYNKIVMNFVMIRFKTHFCTLLFTTTQPDALILFALKRCSTGLGVLGCTFFIYFEK